MYIEDVYTASRPKTVDPDVTPAVLYWQVIAGSGAVMTR